MSHRTSLYTFQKGCKIINRIHWVRVAGRPIKKIYLHTSERVACYWELKVYTFGATSFEKSIT